jgi:hypothetical protein
MITFCIKDQNQYHSERVRVSTPHATFSSCGEGAGKHAAGSGFEQDGEGWVKA